jgi:hypothetical protein
MEYLSLYDYLGKKAGEQLGLEVAIAARTAGIIPQTREISNPVWKGTVNLYPKDFLDFHFRPADDLPGEIDWSIKALEDDDLPF